MIIAAVDPGTRKTGFCVIGWDGKTISLRQIGTIKLREKEPRPERLRRLFVDLKYVFRTWGPADEVVIESAYVGPRVSAAIALGEARGVAIAAAHAVNDSNPPAEISEYPASQVRRLLMAKGDAGKPDIQKVVQRILGLELPPAPDAADAAALAIVKAWGSRAAVGVAGSLPISSPYLPV